VRSARHDVGKAGRRAHDRRQEVEKARIGVQQRKELNASGQARQERVETQERLIGLARLAEGFEQRRRQLRQAFASLGGLDGTIAPEMPTTYDAADVAGTGEAELRQGFERIGIIDIAREHQIPQLAGKLRCRLEKGRVVRFHQLKRVAEGVREAFGVGKANHPRDPLKPLIVFRQDMALLVGHHLDGVFDLAQEPVLRRQRITRIGIDPSARGKHGEHVDRAASAQFGKSPAGDELLGLNEELDLADAPPPELDVVATHSDVTVAAMGVDLALDRVDVRYGGEIHVFAPDIRGQLLQKAHARFDVARQRPRLDHRGALPVLAAALIVMKRRLHRYGERGGSRIGP
jgi:hypothetical protein